MRSQALDLLRALETGPRPLAALAEACDVSMAEVERSLARLAATGFVARDGARARLTAPFEFLDAERISALLGAQARALTIHVHDACPSTNTALLAQETGEGTQALFAEEQSAGRGRRGRRWLSCVGTGITFSLRREFDLPLRELSGLSLVAGVAAVRALRALGAHEVSLKWPNDLLVRGEKLGGILIETRARGAAVRAVIGIGVNCRATPGLEARLRRRIASLDEVASPGPSRNEVAARVLKELLDALDAFEAHGFDAFRNDWVAMHAHEGRRLRVRLADGRVVAGVAEGLAENGGLRLRTRNGLRAVHSGRVVSARVG